MYPLTKPGDETSLSNPERSAEERRWQRPAAPAQRHAGTDRRRQRRHAARRLVARRPR